MYDTKNNIINIIELVRRSKIYIKNSNDYNDLLNNLYLALSNNDIKKNQIKKQNMLCLENCIHIIKKYNLFFNKYQILNEIMVKLTTIIKNNKINQKINFIDKNYMNLIDEIVKNNNYVETLNNLDTKKINILRKNISLFDLLLEEIGIVYDKHVLIKKNDLVEKPIIYNYSIKKKLSLIKELYFFLHLSNMFVNKETKVVSILIFINKIFENYKLVEEHKNFKKTFINKIIQFIECDLDIFHKVFEKYHLDKNILTKWLEIVKN
jgi:hypothetical protein